jgi:hypothetical protein
MFLGLILAKLAPRLRCVRATRPPAGTHFVGTTPHSGTGAKELFQRVGYQNTPGAHVRSGRAVHGINRTYWFLLVPAVMRGA